MNGVPQSSRPAVALFGGCNAGKSSLFNAVTQTDNAVVSEIAGATTDPVVKSMELIPFGPIVLIDTAGLGDDTPLGVQRVQKTWETLNRTDLALVIIDARYPMDEECRKLIEVCQQRGVAHQIVFTKRDLISKEMEELLQREFVSGLFINCYDAQDVSVLRQRLAEQLEPLRDNRLLVADCLPRGSVVVMVVPIDSEAPRGRLILPQVQLIRECLDHGVRCHVTTETGVSEALKELSHIELVVTDSQVFQKVAPQIPSDVPLTSFSILMARQKGELDVLLNGLKAIEHLEEGDSVLIAETCTHNQSHEDIGRVKIPSLLRKMTGKTMDVQFSAGRSYPANLQEYDLIIHCGGCMVTRTEMMNRIGLAKENSAPITNYGLFLAYCNGILDRSVAFFQQPLQKREGVGCVKGK